jgi:hypothetical protein
MSIFIDDKTVETLNKAGLALIDHIENQNISKIEALQKVAQEYDLSPYHLQLLAQAYNNGLSNFYRLNSPNYWKERLPKFELLGNADIIRSFEDAVINLEKRSYHVEPILPDPVQLENILRKEYFNEKCLHKAALASPKIVQKDKNSKNNFTNYCILADRIEKVASFVKSKLSEIKFKIMDYIEKLASWYKTHNIDEDWLLEAVDIIYPKPIKIILGKIIYENRNLKKEASYYKKFVNKVDKNKEPFVTLNIIQQLLNDYRNNLAMISIAKEALARVRSKIPKPKLNKFATPIEGSVINTTKSAEIKKKIKTSAVLDISNLKSLVGTSDEEGDKGPPKAPVAPQLRPTTVYDIKSSVYKAVLTKILVTSKELLAYDPSVVIAAYNALIAIAPTVASRILPAKAFLKLILATGGIDIHTIHTLVMMERDLRSSSNVLLPLQMQENPLMGAPLPIPPL